MSITAAKPKWWVLVLCSLFFFFTGLIFVPYPGIQNDEGLPASALYHSYDALAVARILHHNVPIMLLSYLGAFKAWLYAPLLRVWAPGPLSLRIPVLILGTATAGIFFVLLDRIHGARAACIGTALLVTDTMFLLTTCFDWGPVALQHFLSVTGMLLAIAFYRRQNLGCLAGAALCAGLGFWDKALFAWFFGGVAVATLLVFPRQFGRAVSLRAAAVAVPAFLIGASPLIVYNVTSGFPTFHAAQGFSTRELRPKFQVLRGTWEGVGLFGYVVQEDAAPLPRPPSGIIESFAFRLRSLAGEHRRNGLDWALPLVLICLPWIWRAPAGRIVLFCAIALAAAWLPMALTKEAGFSVHHVVLLWPLPHLLIAVALAEASARSRGVGTAAVCLATLFLTGMNLLCTNQYLYQFARDGSAGSWSDAIYPLAAGLEKEGPVWVGVIDWGISNSLDVLSEGRLKLYWAGDAFMRPPPGQQPPPPPPILLNDPQVLWLAHTDGNEQFQGVNAGVDAFTRRSGYEKVAVGTYCDRNGRAVFQTFRLRRLGTVGH